MMAPFDVPAEAGACDCVCHLPGGDPERTHPSIPCCAVCVWCGRQFEATAEGVRLLATHDDPCADRVFLGVDLTEGLPPELKPST